MPLTNGSIRRLIDMVERERGGFASTIRRYNAGLVRRMPSELAAYRKEIKRLDAIKKVLQGMLEES